MWTGPVPGGRCRGRARTWEECERGCWAGSEGGQLWPPRLLPGSPSASPGARKQVPPRAASPKGGWEGPTAEAPLLRAQGPDRGSPQGYEATPRVTHTPGADLLALACCPQGHATSVSVEHPGAGMHGGPVGEAQGREAPGPGPRMEAESGTRCSRLLAQGSPSAVPTPAASAPAGTF